MNPPDYRWRPIKEAPYDATHIMVRMDDGSEMIAHWACNIWAEEQPAYRGWFTAVNDANDRLLFFKGISTPKEWRALRPGEKPYAR